MVIKSSIEQVRVYASIYERLLAPLLDRIFLGRQDLNVVTVDPGKNAELMRLFYPGPVQLEKLRLGWRQPPKHQHQHQHQEQQQGQQQEEPNPFDFTLFMGDDDSWAAGGELELAVGECVRNYADSPRWDTTGLHGADFYSAWPLDTYGRSHSL